MFKIKSLYRLIIYSIIFILILTSCFTFIVLNIAKNEFNEKVSDLKEVYVADKKILLKNDVNMVLEFINLYIHDHKEHKTKNQLQNGVLKSISKLKKGKKNEYFFIYDFNKTLILSQSLQNSIGSKKAPMEKLISTSKEPNGGYIQYKRVDKSLNSYAISYVTSFKKWNWVIGKGVYIDEIDQLIEQKEIKYHENIEYYTYQIAILTILLALYSMFIYKNATRVIIKDVKVIREYFEKQNHEKPLDTNYLSFGEFKIIANYASNALKTIQTKRTELENINKNLEKIVSQKTVELSSLVQSQQKFIKYSVHEINTPLSIIRNNIDLFKMKSPKNVYVTNIESGAKIIQYIYDELSYLIKEDKFEYKKEYLNFSQVLRDRIEFFNEIAKSNSLYFTCRIEDDIYINFNYIQLQRIIDNNLSNAIKYSFANSPIDVDLHYIDDKIVEFCIKTNSKQISHTKKVFDGFYREDDAKGGFGLGLSMIKDICNKNSVTIELISNEKYTQFEYRFNINEDTITRR